MTLDGVDREKNILLYVGSILPRKDIPSLLRAFGTVGREIPSQLIIAGSARASQDGHKALINNLGISDKVVWLHDLTDEGLAELYNVADVYVMPSQYEGFGLPVVEAMAAGTPVVSTDGGSLAEVVGSAGLLCPVGAPTRLANQILRLLTDEALYHELVKAGRRQAQNFTWDRTVENTLHVYSQLL